MDFHSLTYTNLNATMECVLLRSKALEFTHLYRMRKHLQIGIRTRCAYMLCLRLYYSNFKVEKRTPVKMPRNMLAQRCAQHIYPVICICIDAPCAWIHKHVFLFIHCCTTHTDSATFFLFLFIFLHLILFYVPIL